VRAFSAFNNETSSKRVVVEWTFGDLKANWPFINFPDNKLKIGKSPVGKNCVGSPNQTCRCFRLQSLTLEQYLDALNH
jgi:hypothetical protein